MTSTGDGITGFRIVTYVFKLYTMKPMVSIETSHKIIVSLVDYLNPTSNSAAVMTDVSAAE